MRRKSGVLSGGHLERPRLLDRDRARALEGMRFLSLLLLPVNSVHQDTGWVDGVKDCEAMASFDVSRVEAVRLGN
jgi:hypothetical protein